MNPQYEWDGKRANHCSAKLTEQDVYLIKGLLKEGVRPIEIAKKFEVSRFSIYRIKRGVTWLHVPEYGEA